MFIKVSPVDTGKTIFVNTELISVITPQLKGCLLNGHNLSLHVEEKYDTIMNLIEAANKNKRRDRNG